MKRLIALSFVLFFGTANAVDVTDFTGYYDCANWSQVENGGTIVCTEDWIYELGANEGSAAYTYVAIAANAHSQISFDWDYLTYDEDGPFYDNFGYFINGVFTQLSDNAGAVYQYGSAAFEVFTGDVFGFAMYTTDGAFGAADAYVWNFSAVPEPGTLALLGLGLLGLGLSRKKA